MASKFKAPDLSNATPSFLIDESAKLSIIENYTKKMRKVYREALFARLGDDYKGKFHEGEQYIAAIGEYDDTRLDQTLLKTELPDVFEKYTRTKPITKMTFSAKPGTVNEDAAKFLEDLKRELDLED